MDAMRILIQDLLDPTLTPLILKKTRHEIQRALIKSQAI